MAITLTGTKYASGFSSISGKELTVSGVSFSSGDFSTRRVAALFNSSNIFKGISYVRQFVSATELELESAFFDPVDNSTVVPVSGDFVDISLNFTELATTNLSVTGNTVTASDHLYFGSSGNQRSLCLYDENKQIDLNNVTFQLYGGCTVFGHLTSTESLVSNKPVNISFGSDANGFKFYFRDPAVNFIQFGGSINTGYTPSYLGGYSGSYAQTCVLSGVSITDFDLLSVGAGGSWGANPERHVLRNIKSFASSSNAILSRWGDGVIEGGSYQISGAGSLGVFGSDSTDNYVIGAATGERMLIAEAGSTASGAPWLWRSGGGTQNITYKNVLVSKRDHSSGTSTGTFVFDGTYSNLPVDSKLRITKNSDSTIVDSVDSAGGGNYRLEVTEATVNHITETVVESAWGYSAVSYLTDIEYGTFATTTVETIGGTAKDVQHGFRLNSLSDLSISESDPAAVSAYSLVDSAAKFYDSSKLWLYENFTGQQSTVVTRSGAAIHAGSYDVVLDATATQLFAFSSDTITIKTNNYPEEIITTGTITAQNGAAYTFGRNIFTANGLPDQQWGAALYNLTGMPSLIEYKLGSGTSVTFQTSVDPADSDYLLIITPPGCRGIQFRFNPQNSATFTASPDYYLDSNGDRIYDPAVHTLNENISVNLEPATPVVTLPANTVTAGVDVARLAMYMYQFPIGIEKLVYGADPGNFIEYTDFLQVLDLGDSQLQASGPNASLSSFVIQKNGAPISPTAEFTPAIREIVTGGGVSGGGLTEAQLNAAVADIKGADDKDLTQVFDNTPDVNLGTIPDDVTAILADTNELQQNQNSWITATGFATPVDVPTAEQNAAAVEAALADDFANIDVDNQGIADAVVAGIGESVAVVSVVRPGAQSVSMSVGESNISVAVGDDQTYGMQVA